jgi:hypothetical protein
MPRTFCSGKTLAPSYCSFILIHEAQHELSSGSCDKICLFGFKFLTFSDQLFKFLTLTQVLLDLFILGLNMRTTLLIVVFTSSIFWPHIKCT